MLGSGRPALGVKIQSEPPIYGCGQARNSKRAESYQYFVAVIDAGFQCMPWKELKRPLNKSKKKLTILQKAAVVVIVIFAYSIPTLFGRAHGVVLFLFLLPPCLSQE